MGVRAIITITDTAATATTASARFWSGWASPEFQIPHLADFYTWTLRELLPLNLASYRTFTNAYPGTLPAEETTRDDGSDGDLDYRYELTFNEVEHGLRLAVYNLTQRQGHSSRTPRTPVTTLTQADLYDEAAGCCDALAARADQYADTHGGAQLPHLDPIEWRERADAFREHQQAARTVAITTNLAATFHPASFDAPRPALEIAGVLVLAYINALGELRVSVGLDNAEDWLITDGGTVPMRITVQGHDVFQG